MRSRWLLAALVWNASAADPKAVEFFEKQVRPILAERCYSCHSAASKPVMGKLLLDNRAALLKGGSRGTALVPGDPDQSLLVKALRHSDGALRMPPAGKLSDAEIARIAEWVRLGAPWGAEPQGTPAQAVAPFWSFQTPQQPQLPEVRDRSWVRNPIDYFVLAALEKKGLTPAPAASKRVWIRRVTFDLIGLPPTSEEIRNFLADGSPDAQATVVDRLLASPRYGERWGRHWLDVARYGDSNGLDENLVFINAWRFRDYVVAAFNDDKPYDQFIHEQLAGDLLPRTPDARREYERLIATGFLSLGAKMLAEDDPVKMEMDIVDEQVDTTARAFMGLTLGCARCHDHKFDPIPSADYYSLAGIFRSTKTMENFKVVAKWHEHVLAPDADRETLEAHEKRIEAKRKELETLTKPANSQLQAEARKRTGDYLLAASRLAEAQEIKLTHAERDASIFDCAFSHGKECEFQAPRDGLYQLEFHYSSAEARSVALYLNGEFVKSSALARATGTTTPDTWSVEGIFSLRSGRNTVRLERETQFPKVEQVLIAPSTLPPDRVPKTALQLAAERNVNPEFLTQWADFLRRTRDDENSILRKWHAAGRENHASLAAQYQAAFDDAARAEKPNDEQKPFREVLFDKFGPFAVPANPSRFYPAGAAAQVKQLEAEIKSLEKQTPKYPRAMGVREGKIANLRIHHRGNYLTLGDEVPRRFLRAIAGDNQAPIGNEESGRLAFARWLTRPDHPLTSRVMVNRIWRWHFGAGIVPSVDNFGRLGEAPSNQPLLDWLARRFIDSGWSIKQMHRLILLSATYNQTAAHNEKAFNLDPENRLLWRMNRRRLEAEAIRDSVVAMGGQLDLKMGGTMLTFKDREYVTSTENKDTTDYDVERRSVYLPVTRSSLYDVFSAFDFGDPSVLNGDRPTTTVAPQALFMMNSSLVQKSSRRMAEMLIARSVDPNERIIMAYERAFGRSPSDQETARALEAVRRLDQAWVVRESNPAERQIRAWQGFCRVLMSANEFVYVE